MRGNIPERILRTAEYQAALAKALGHWRGYAADLEAAGRWPRTLECPLCLWSENHRSDDRRPVGEGDCWCVLYRSAGECHGCYGKYSAALGRDDYPAALYWARKLTAVMEGYVREVTE